MGNVVFNIEKRFSEELLNLRIADFHNGEFSKKESEEEFDKYSFFPTLRINGELIGATRITDTALVSTFKKWSKGVDETPKGESCYEMSRTVIKKQWQNKAMYHVLSICSLNYLKKRNVLTVNSILELEINLKNYFQRFGALECGQPYMCYDLPCTPSMVQAYSLDLKSPEFIIRLQRESERIIKVVNSRGFQIMYQPHPHGETIPWKCE